MAVVKPLELHPAALAEGEEAAIWYAELDPRIAARFAEELESSLRHIAAAPERWPAHLHGSRRVRMRRFPYFIAYREEPSRILVVAIAHTRRKPGYWTAR